MTLFDDMNQVNGWEATNDAENALNTVVVENNSLRFTYNEIPQVYNYGWGGMFYKRPIWGQVFDFSQEPVIRLNIKADDPATLPNLTLEIVTTTPEDTWRVSTYNLAGKITTVYQQIEIDLRYPDSGVITPNLASIVQISFTHYGTSITNKAFNVESIEVIPAPYMPLMASIEPTEAQVFLNGTVRFVVSTVGGTSPINYSWYIDGQPTEDVGNTLDVLGNSLGAFIIRCDVIDQLTALSVTASLIVIEQPPPPPPPPQGFDYLKSEVRGVLIHSVSDVTDWNLVAQTCVEYGINAVYLGTEINQFRSGRFSAIDAATNAFHAVGIRVHILNIIGLAPIDDGSLTAAVDINGNLLNTYPGWWTCLVKQASKNAFNQLASNLASNYNIDGFNFDYIRWRDLEMCFCTECRDKFITDTGLTDIIWPSDVYAIDSKYHWQWIDWRMEQVTQLIREMVAVFSSNPNIELDAAAFPAFSNTNSWQTMVIGQDVGQWVAEGLLDAINPMIGETDFSAFQDLLNSSLKFFTGGNTITDGAIPTIPYMGYGQIEGPTSTWVEAVSLMRSLGGRGFILWRYGGPGLESQRDIRPYMAALDLPEVFNITDIKAFMNPEATAATITWKTSTPTTSSVEYSIAPLFVAEPMTGEYGRLHTYINVNYVGGILIEDLTLKTGHEIIIPAQQRTYFRVQSISANGQVVTSRTHTTDEVPTPPTPEISKLILRVLGLTLLMRRRK